MGVQRKIIHSRLPPIDAALVLEAIGLEVFRDQFGGKACLDRGVGPRRKKLGPLPPERVLSIPAELARDEARAVLAGLCDVCPFRRCAMKAWGI